MKLIFKLLLLLAISFINASAENSVCDIADSYKQEPMPKAKYLILLDRSGTIKYAVKQNPEYSALFNRTIFWNWIHESTGLNFDNDDYIFYPYWYGLEGPETNNRIDWKNRYFEPLSDKPIYTSNIANLMHQKLNSIEVRNYGLSSLAPELSAFFLTQCSGNDSKKSSDVYIVNITDYNSNIADGSNSNEIAATTNVYRNKDQAKNDVTTWLDKMKEYYKLDPVGRSVTFYPTKDTLAYASGYQITDRKLLKAEIKKLNPAKKLDKNAFFAFDEALKFNMTKDGYELDAPFRINHPDGEAYKLEKVVIRFAISGEDKQTQVVAYDNSAGITNKRIKTRVGEKTTSDNLNIQIDYKFRYKPSGYDVGLIIEGSDPVVKAVFQEQYLILEKSSIGAGDQVYMTIDLMKKYPKMTQEQIKYYLQKKRKMLEMLIYGVLIGALLFIIIFVLYYLIRGKWRMPLLELTAEPRGVQLIDLNKPLGLIEVGRVNFDDKRVRWHKERKGKAATTFFLNESHAEDGLEVSSDFFVFKNNQKSIQQPYMPKGSISVYVNATDISNIRSYDFKDKEYAAECNISAKTYSSVRKASTLASKNADMLASLRFISASYKYSVEHTQHLTEQDYCFKRELLHVSTITINNKTDYTCQEHSRFSLDLKLDKDIGDGAFEKCENDRMFIKVICNAKDVVYDGAYAAGLGFENDFRSAKVEIYFVMTEEDPVYTATEFSISAGVECRRSASGTAEKNEYVAKFLINENPESSDLVIKYGFDNGKEMCIFNDQPVLYRTADVLQSDAADGIIHLDLINSARNPDAENPNNIVIINEIKLESPLQDHFYIKQVKDGNRDFSGMEIMPSEFFTASVMLNKRKMTDNDFESKVNRVKITIQYSHYDITTQETMDDEKVINVTFSLVPNYGKSMVAIDFGTSAICEAGIQENGKKEPIESLYKLGLLRERNKVTGKEYEYIVDSTILITEEMGGLTYELKTSEFDNESLATNRILVNSLKTYLATDIKDLRMPSGAQVEIDNVITGIYKYINEKLTIPLRNGEPYKRIVFTHPNSYLDGQVRYIKSKIKKAIPSIKDIENIGESDSVINFFIKSGQFQEYIKAEEMTFLSVDMGAGTLDITARKLFFRKSLFEDGRTVYVPDNKAKSELLGMISSNIAGDYLDRLLVEYFYKQLCKMVKEYNSIDGVNKTDQMEIIDFFQQSGNVELSRYKSLVQFLAAVKKGKENINYEHESLELLFEKFSGFQNVRFINVNLAKLARLFEVYPQYSEFIELRESEGGNRNDLVLHMPLEKIRKYIEKHFHSKAAEYLEGLIGNNDAIGKIDTVIFSGRALRFPGVIERFESVLRESGFANAVSVNLDNIKDNATTKSAVVQGALLYGKDCFVSQKKLFQTPQLHGGILVFMWYAGKCVKWDRVVTHTQIESGESISKLYFGSMFDSSSVDQIYVFQSNVANDVIVQKYINQTEENFRLNKNIREEMEKTGFFRFIQHIPMDAYEDSEMQVGIRPMAPDVNPDSEDFSNMRISIGLYCNNKPISEVGHEDGETVFSVSNKLYRAPWPNDVLYHIGE